MKLFLKPITLKEDTLEEIKLEEWDKPKVLEIFEELRFNRYIDKFGLRGISSVDGTNIEEDSKEKHFEIVESTEIPNLKEKKLYYFEYIYTWSRFYHNNWKYTHSNRS